MRRYWLIASCLLAISAWAFDATPLLQWVQADVRDPYLVAWYKLDGNALDSSNNGRNGTWSGTEAYTNGVTGSAAAFNGSSQIDLGAPIDAACRLFATNGCAFTVLYWSRVENNVATIPVARGGANFALRTFQVFTERSVSAAATPRIIIRGANTDTSLGHDDNTWHHHAIVWDGTAGRFHADGGAAINLNIGTAAEETQNVLLGARAGNPRSGYLDDVRIYNRALSSNDVARIYQGLKPLHD